MKENTLIRICLAGSILGIVSLYFLSFMIVPVEMDAGSITNEDVGMLVRLSGTVTNLRNHPSGHVFFELHDDSGSIDVVIWEDKVEQLSLSGFDVSTIGEGDEIELVGSTELYRGNVQVVV